eukprot:scaffold7576_cov417-Prasinococcus_capsulatus_cf.AAC.1
MVPAPKLAHAHVTAQAYIAKELRAGIIQQPLELVCDGFSRMMVWRNARPDESKRRGQPVNHIHLQLHAFGGRLSPLCRLHLARRTVVAALERGLRALRKELEQPVHAIEAAGACADDAHLERADVAGGGRGKGRCGGGGDAKPVPHRAVRECAAVGETSKRQARPPYAPQQQHPLPPSNPRALARLP